MVKNEGDVFVVKAHFTLEGKKLLAICDKEILGKIFEQGNRQLDISSDFYKGEEVDEEKLRGEIGTANILNVVGDKSIKLLQKYNLADDKHIMYVSKVPHAQVLLADK